MKARRVITLVLGVLLLCSSMTMAVPALNIYDIDEPYVYPIVPGTPEWAALDSRVTKGQVCQIPEDILSRMTTSALLETVLDYPLLGDIYAWNSPDQGFSVLLNSFNGLSELVSRPDFAQVLETFDLQDTAIAESTVSYKMMVAEMGRERLFDFAIKSPYITLSSEQTRAVVPPPFIPTPGDGSDTYLPTVYTPAGSYVAAWYNLTAADFLTTDSALAAADASIQAQYPNAVRLSSADPSYNCHAYAVYTGGYACDFWIDNPMKFYTDGSFLLTTDASPYYPKYVYFYDPDFSSSEQQYYRHSMIQINADTYRSKWGPYGVYRHSLMDNPYYTETDDQDVTSSPFPVKRYLLNPNYDDYFG